MINSSSRQKAQQGHQCDHENKENLSVIPNYAPPHCKGAAVASACEKHGINSSQDHGSAGVVRGPLGLSRSRRRLSTLSAVIFNAPPPPLAADVLGRLAEGCESPSSCVNHDAKRADGPGAQPPRQPSPPAHPAVAYAEVSSGGAVVKREASPPCSSPPSSHLQPRRDFRAGLRRCSPSLVSEAHRGPNAATPPLLPSNSPYSATASPPACAFAAPAAAPPLTVEEEDLSPSLTAAVLVPPTASPSYSSNCIAATAMKPQTVRQRLRHRRDEQWGTDGLRGGHASSLASHMACLQCGHCLEACCCRGAPAPSHTNTLQPTAASVEDVSSAATGLCCAVCGSRGVEDTRTCCAAMHAADANTIVLLENCPHAVCAQCFAAANERMHDEDDDAMSAVVCPLPGCGVPVAPANHRRLLGDDAVDAADRARFASLFKLPRIEEGVLVECPCCSALIEIDQHINGSNGERRVRCLLCEATFCGECGAHPYHAGLSCASWRRRSAAMLLAGPDGEHAVSMSCASLLAPLLACRFCDGDVCECVEEEAEVPAPMLLEDTEDPEAAPAQQHAHNRRPHNRRRTAMHIRNVIPCFDACADAGGQFVVRDPRPGPRRGAVISLGDLTDLDALIMEMNQHDAPKGAVVVAVPPAGHQLPPPPPPSGLFDRFLALLQVRSDDKPPLIASAAAVNVDAASQAEVGALSAARMRNTINSYLADSSNVLTATSPMLDVCGGLACRSQAEGVCKWPLPECGHPCFAACHHREMTHRGDRDDEDAEGEKSRGTHHACMTCLVEGCPQNTSHGQTCEDYCSICYTDALKAHGCVQLGCGHVFHLACVVRRLQARWPSQRIVFSYLDCPTCGTLMEAAPLQALLAPHLAFRDYLGALMLRRLHAEGLASCAAIASDITGRYYQRPALYAAENLSYYRCQKCHCPYFGGFRQCEALLLPPDRPGDGNGGGGGGAALPPPVEEEYLCSRCFGGGTNQCRVHDPSMLRFKCRFCCSVATWLCWGSTRFCDACHKRQEAGEYLTRKPLSEFAKCTPDTCPLRIAHPPNGTKEFCLGCSLCGHQE